MRWQSLSAPSVVKKRIQDASQKNALNVANKAQWKKNKQSQMLMSYILTLIIYTNNLNNFGGV